jgi:Flp pilus assembly protein TadG
MRTSSNNSQSAQGMVEFALVLPILLLLILGVIAVGHLFFTYSFVLSSSREAARYGAAVGTTTGGKIYYQDCDGIRAAAERVGGVAGVKASNVTVNYDKGPDTAAASAGNCPIGGTGPNVNLGDRIYVQVTLPYKPIVPLVNFPEFTLRANTYRTIIKSVSVGNSPDAETNCNITTTTLSMNPRPSIVGQQVTYSVSVSAAGAPAPTTANSVAIIDVDFDDEGNIIETELCRTGVTYGAGSCSAPIYTAGIHYVNARYEGSVEGTCYDPSEAFDVEQRVNMSATTTQILSTSPNPSFNSAPVLVTVQVRASFPGGGIPAGMVNITGGSSSCSTTLDEAGIGSCTFYPVAPSSGNNITIRADYAGNSNYQSSYGYYTHSVRNPTPTFVNSPTPGGPTATPDLAPTTTPIPLNCPRLASEINFSVQTDGFLLSIHNTDPLLSVSVTSFTLEWPTLPTARLQQVRFATNTSNGCSGQNSTCMWQDNSGVNPPSVTVNSTDKTKWSDTNALMSPNQTKEMRFVFGHTLPNGTYRLRVNFSNTCILDIPPVDRSVAPQ